MNGVETTGDSDDCAKAESAETRELIEQALFIEMFDKQQKEVHRTAQDKGWWDRSEAFLKASELVIDNMEIGEAKGTILGTLRSLSERNDAEMIALMHSELSEALEALRHGNPQDDKVPEFDSLTVELADVMIRMMDFCGHHKLPLAAAVIAKMDMNRGRSHKHGGKKF